MSRRDLIFVQPKKVLKKQLLNGNWGQTKRRWNGLDVSFDGLRIDSHRRWKDVNHGTWTRYRAWLIDPDKQLQIHFANLRQAENQGAAFDLTIDAQIGAVGRLSEWNRAPPTRVGGSHD